MELYPDQREWCRAIVDAFEKPSPENDHQRFTRVMGVAATGAGKTIMSAAIIKYVLARWLHHSRTCRVLFLADSDELVNQAQEKIYRFTGHPTDREKASDRASLESLVVVGSIQTLQNPQRRERYPTDHFDLVIVDEAHQSMADTWRAVMEYFNEGGARVLGITATPERGDDRDLWDWWEHKAAEIGLFELIEKKRLAPIRVKTLPIDLDCRGIRKTREGLNEEELAHALEPSFEAIIEAWEHHGEGRKTLWFLPGCEASRRFAAMLVSRGHRAEHVDGGSADRRLILERYEKTQIDHLSNSNLLIKGYDCPDISCVVNLSPGKSRVAYQQKVGRGTRVCEGKSDLLLLDFLWQFDKLGLARPVDLVARTKDEARRMQEKLDQQARDSDKEAYDIDSLDLHDQRELTDNELVKSLIKQLVNNTSRRTRVYDASAAAALIDAPELLNYEPEAEWEHRQPTDRQKEILNKKGISVQTIKTRGQASAYLETMIERQEKGLCTFKQAARLTANGIENASQMTFEEASEAMRDLIAGNQSSR